MKRLPKILPADEVQLFLRSFAPDQWLERRNRLICQLMYRCGLRVSEVLGIRIPDIDIKRATIRIIGKGDKERIVSVDPQTLAMTMRWIDERLQTYARHPNRQRIEQSDLLFMRRRDGGQIGYRAIEQMIARKAQDLGMPKLTPHMLRHCYATERLEEGMPLADLQDQLGHSYISTTSIYLHGRNSRIQGHIAQLPAI